MPLPLSFSITTSRFSLRSPSESDIPAIFEATRDPHFNEGMVWDPPESHEELLAFHQSSLREWKEGTRYLFSIYMKDSNTLCGRISLRLEGAEEHRSKEWSIGYFTLPSFQGKGVMSECVAALLRVAFEDLAIPRIEASYAVWNEASKRVLTRNGFLFDRHTLEGFKKRGEWVAEDIVVIERSRWLHLNGAT